MRRGIAIALLALLGAACEPALEPLTPIGETRIDCQGVPPQQCQQALNEARAASNLPVVSLIVRCSAPPCTFQQGQIEIQAQFADGTTSGWGSGWSAAVPAPMPVDPARPQPAPPQPVAPLPVAPVCIGVVQSLCMDMASNAMINVTPGSPPVASITIRCTAACLPNKGEGQSVVVFADGTNMISEWAFETMGGS